MDVHPPKYSKIDFDTSPYLCHIMSYSIKLAMDGSCWMKLVLDPWCDHCDLWFIHDWDVSSTMHTWWSYYIIIHQIHVASFKSWKNHEQIIIYVISHQINSSPVDRRHSSTLDPVRSHKNQWSTTHWIGLRENLQETMVFTIKYRAFL